MDPWQHLVVGEGDHLLEAHLVADVRPVLLPRRVVLRGNRGRGAAEMAAAGMVVGQGEGT